MEASKPNQGCTGVNWVWNPFLRSSTVYVPAGITPELLSDRLARFVGFKLGNGADGVCHIADNGAIEHLRSRGAGRYPFRLG